MTKTKVMNWLQKNTMTLILVLVFAFFAWRTEGKILMPNNISNLIAQNAYVFILATGMLLCILTGGNIDLAVGSVVCFAGAVGALMMANGTNMWVAVAVMLAIGGAPTMGIFVFLKFLQGMVSPFMDNVCTGYTSDLHSSRRGSAVGVLFMCFSLASALMPTFNTFVVDTLGMPWYASYRIIGIYLAVVGLLFLVTFGVLLPRPQTEFTAKKNLQEKKKLSIREMFGNRNMRALFVSNVTMSFYNYFSMFLPTYFYLTNADVYTTAVRGAIATAASMGRLCSRIRKR